MSFSVFIDNISGFGIFESELLSGIHYGLSSFENSLNELVASLNIGDTTLRDIF